jgi:hypothetical protein
MQKPYRFLHKDSNDTRSQPTPFGVSSRELAAVLVDRSVIIF